MAVEIQVAPSIADQVFSVLLAGEVFGVRVRWNGRDESWYMHLYDADGAAIRLGIRLVLGTFFRSNSDPRFPKGSLRMVDTSGQGVEARFDDLGVRVKLKFTPYTEIIAMESEAGLE